MSDSYDDSHTSPTHAQQQQQAAAAAAGKAAQQQQSFSQGDEEDEDEEEEEEASASMESPPPKASKKDSKRHSKKDKSALQGKPSNMSAASGGGGGGLEAQKAGSSSEDDSESEEDGDAEGGGGGGGAGAQDASPAPAAAHQPSQAKLYNAADYKHLVVSSEIQGLFEYILRHKHTDIELETKMKPFIPDYIPAVGEIDAFLKVPRPDGEGKKAPLGLVVLDEPAAAQSDPTVLELSLRAVNKQVISRHATVGSIEHADKNQARVVKWIQSIEEVHRKKPPPHVHYSRTMPDIEQLMQVWPPEFEELLKSQASELPDMNTMDCDVETFARMVCAIMDIPVYDGKVTESLHVLFTLYSEFQNHAYFQH